MACQKGFHHHQRSVTGASHNAIRRKQFDTILLVNQQKFDNQTCNTNTTSIAINIIIKGSGGRGEENELSGTRPLATPLRERSSRSVGSRDGLSGSVELEAALRAVERNFLQPSLRRLLWASSASYNTHNNSLTQSLSNQCFRSGLNCLRQFHIG